MNLIILAAVSLAGGVGAMLRHAVTVIVSPLVSARFPWAILAVNLSGSFALGFVTGAATTWLDPLWATVIGVGLLGGYTTFSTASWDTVQLLRHRRWRAALVNGFGQLGLALVLGLLGMALGSSL